MEQLFVINTGWFGIKFNLAARLSVHVNSITSIAQILVKLHRLAVFSNFY